MQPNHEKPGGPNSPTSKKIFLNNVEYNLWNKHAEYIDQQMGAGHILWCNRDVKLMKVCAIILMGMMILALKVLALYTIKIELYKSQ